jgi:hypothetical protein
MSFITQFYFDDASEDIPVCSDIRYILWYLDKTGKKIVVKITHNFDDVKTNVGNEYPLITLLNHKTVTEASKSFVSIEQLNISEKWDLLLIYTKHQGKKIVMFDSYHYCKYK